MSLLRLTGIRFIRNGTVLRMTKTSIVDNQSSGKRNQSSVAAVCVSLLMDSHAWSFALSTVGLIGTSNLVYQTLNQRQTFKRPLAEKDKMLSMAGFVKKVSSKIQHIASMGKEIPAGVNRWFDRFTIFNLISSGSALIWIGGNEVRLIPVAEKYFLAGDTDVVEKVKTQIHAECIRPKFMQMTRIMRNIDIEIIENKKQYKTLNDDENKQIAILLCISTDTKGNYCLPDESPQKTKLSKYVLVETIGGENTLYEDLLCSLRESPKTAGFVKDSLVTAISPIIPEQYMNTKISTDTWHFCYFCFGICVSIIAKGKLKDIVSKR